MNNNHTTTSQPIRHQITLRPSGPDPTDLADLFRFLGNHDIDSDFGFVEGTDPVILTVNWTDPQGRTMAAVEGVILPIDSVDTDGNVYDREGDRL